MNSSLKIKAVCLCLDKREKEWLDLEKQCDEVGIHFTRFLAGDGKLLAGKYKYDYIDKENPDVNQWGYGREGYKYHHWNVLACHKIMLKLAQEREYENVLFLEDDAYITSRFLNIWQYLTPFIKELDFDFLYLGYWWNEITDYPLIEKLYKEHDKPTMGKVVGNCGGFHGVLLNNRIYNALINLPHTNPLDYQLNCLGHDKLKSYMILPKIVHTKSMISNCEGYLIEREKL